MEKAMGTPNTEADDYVGFDEDDDDDVEGEESGATPDGSGALFGSSILTHDGAAQRLPNGKKTKGRVKIKMEYIGNKLRRYTTFSKRKTGIMKKAHELSTLTGTQVMLLVASETGHVYAFATHKLRPMIDSEPGKRFIQHCLNAADRDNCQEMDDTIRTEFTLDPHLQPLQTPQSQAGAINQRKRKLIADTELLSLPTMVSPGRLPFVSSPRAGTSSESSLTLDESFGGGVGNDDEGEQQAEENDETADDFHVALKKWRPDGGIAVGTDKRVRIAPRPMKWTTQTLSTPPSLDNGSASISAPSSSINASKQTQLQRTLKEVLKYAADQRQRQKQPLPARPTASDPRRSDKGQRNGNNNKSPHNNAQQQQQQFSKNQQAAFQQQLNAILPFMLQAAAFSGNGMTSTASTPLGFAEADSPIGGMTNDDEDGGAVGNGGMEADVAEMEGAGDNTPTTLADNPFQQIFGGKFPFANNAFQQLFVSAALSQKISENSRG